MHLYKHEALRGDFHNIHFGFVYFLAVVVTYHTLLVAYTTSSFMGTYLSPTAVGALHGLGALLSVGCFLIFPYLLREFGNVLTSIGIMLIAIVCLLVLAFGGSPLTLIIALLVFLMVNPITYLSIDVFSETLIGKDESDTGSKRGLILALMSAGAIMAPLTMGFIMGENNDYTQLFFAAAGVGLLYVAVIVGIFRQFYDPVYELLDTKSMVHTLTVDLNIRIVTIAHFLLQLFFTWMIVYVPLYLITVVGFTWAEVSYIIAAGLAAYVIFEYPIGILADRYWGEKEMMAVGFVIVAITTACIGLMAGVGVLGWMLLMFINRIGASLVEVTTESYFFKKVDGKDSSLMSLFRLLRPGASVAGALIGSLLLLFVPFTAFFLIGSLILVIGVFIPRYLVDTK